MAGGHVGELAAAGATDPTLFFTVVSDSGGASTLERLDYVGGAGQPRSGGPFDHQPGARRRQLGGRRLLRRDRHPRLHARRDLLRRHLAPPGRRQRRHSPRRRRQLPVLDGRTVRLQPPTAASLAQQPLNRAHKRGDRTRRGRTMKPMSFSSRAPRTRRRFLRLGVVALVPLGLALVAACSDNEQDPGSLVVAVDTNVPLPGHVDSFALEVVQDGVIIYGNSFQVADGPDQRSHRGASPGHARCGQRAASGPAGDGASRRRQHHQWHAVGGVVARGHHHRPQRRHQPAAHGDRRSVLRRAAQQRDEHGGCRVGARPGVPGDHLVPEPADLRGRAAAPTRA